MTATAESLLDQVDALPVSERRDFVMKLVNDADEHLSSEILPVVKAKASETPWEAEISRRVEEIKSGKAVGVPFDEGMKSIRAKLRNA